MAVVPAESSGEDSSFIAFFKDEPFFLPDAGVGVVTPEIDAPAACDEQTRPSGGGRGWGLRDVPCGSEFHRTGR